MRVILRLFYIFSLLFVRVINLIIVIVIAINIWIVIVRVINIYILEMPLHHDAFERRASAQAAVRNQLKRIRHSLEFRPEERVGLVSGHIRRWIKKALYYFTISKAYRKF